MAYTLAELATLAIGQQQMLHSARQLTEQLQSASSSRIVIEQATGQGYSASVTG